MSSTNETSNRSLYPWFYGFLVLLPFLSATAAYMGFHDALMGAFLVLALTSSLVIWKGYLNLDERLIVMLVWSISLSLILSSAFASDYLRGSDIHLEYQVALQTASTGVWSTLQLNTFTSVLSLTILPRIINIVSAFSILQVLKFVYPLIFSLVPVILYKITRKILTPGAAFLSVFFFMSYYPFSEFSFSLSRQEIAELFLVVLLLVLFSPAIRNGALGRITQLLLIAMVVVSHYSILYILIIILTFSYATSRTFRQAGGLMLFGLVLVVGTAWYTFTAGGAGMLALGNAMSSIVDLFTGGMFSSASRPVQVMQALGTASISPGPLQQANRWIQLLVQLCLLLGFFVLVFKKKSDMEREMLPMMTGAMIVLGSSILLPGVAATLNFDRIYHIVLLFIAPLFIYGAERIELTLRSIRSRIRTHGHPRIPAVTQRNTLRLAAGILFLYFLFVSGWFAAVTDGQPTSYILDANRMRNSTSVFPISLYYAQFTVLPDISGATWFHNYDNGRSICSDSVSQTKVLTSYGGVPGSSGGFQASGKPNNLLANKYDCDYSNSYVFLSEFNNLYGLGFTYPSGTTFPISIVWPRLSEMVRVYDNGETTIYVSP